MMWVGEKQTFGFGFPAFSKIPILSWRLGKISGHYGLASPEPRVLYSGDCDVIVPGLRVKPTRNPGMY
jgi:hypothetical protein